MKAVTIDQFGDSSVLKHVHLQNPVPGENEVLVRVSAVGLNPVDFKIRQGHLDEIFPTKFPRILGGDISGIVEGLGVGAHDFKIGDAVFFSNPLDRNGGYADYVVVDQRIVAKKPVDISHVDAASLPVVGLTAVQALRDFSKIKKGDKVLIHAGAGGVGSFAIQYAKAKGAIVFSTSSAGKADYLRSLGVDRHIDYAKEDFVKVAEDEGGMDIVFETVGGENYGRSLEATKDGGYLPSIVDAPSAEVLEEAKRRGISTGFMLLEGRRSDLDEIGNLVSTHKLKPTVSTTLKFEEIKLGHQLLESGRTVGKIVVRVNE